MLADSPPSRSLLAYQRPLRQGKAPGGDSLSLQLHCRTFERTPRKAYSQWRDTSGIRKRDTRTQGILVAIDRIQESSEMGRGVSFAH